jgi:hypothetical protein
MVFPSHDGDGSAADRTELRWLFTHLCICELLGCRSMSLETWPEITCNGGHRLVDASSHDTVLQRWSNVSDEIRMTAFEGCTPATEV